MSHENPTKHPSGQPLQQNLISSSVTRKISPLISPLLLTCVVIQIDTRRLFFIPMTLRHIAYLLLMFEFKNCSTFRNHPQPAVENFVGPTKLDLKNGPTSAIYSFILLSFTTTKVLLMAIQSKTAQTQAKKHQSKSLATSDPAPPSAMRDDKSESEHGAPA